MRRVHNHLLESLHAYCIHETPHCEFKGVELDSCGGQVARADAAGDAGAAAGVTEPARRNLQAAASASCRFGWISFWSQLSLSVVSAFILIFSVSFSATVGLKALTP